MLVERFAVRLGAAAAALAAVALMIHAGWTALLAWTDPLIPTWRYPFLFGGLLALYAACRRWPGQRKRLLLIGSLAALLWFDPRFAAGSLLFLLAWYLVVFAPVHRHLKLGFLVITYGGLMAVSNLLWFPDLLVAHPWVLTLTYAFAVSYTFRLFYFFHEMKMRKFARVPVDDFLLYFIFAPYYIVVPYMFAIPRYGQFVKGLAGAGDPKVEASGVRLLLMGAATLALTWAALQLYVPRDQLMAQLHAGDWAAALGTGLLYYPIQVVIEALGVAWVLTGMVQLLGVDMRPAFHRPLGATSIHEWWRRWNTHFRDFLVDIFFYPLMLRWRKKNPYLTIIVGCASVFLIGSMVFHWIGKYWFVVAGHDNVYWSMGVENLLMFAAVAIGLCLEKRRMLQRKPPTHPSPRKRGEGIVHLGASAGGILGTWVFLLAVVVFAGYGTTWAAYHRPLEQVQGRVDRAMRLAAAGDRDAAAAEIAPALPVLEAQVRHLPREPVRRLELAFARSLPAPAGDPDAAAAHLRIARAFGSLADPRQAALWAIIDDNTVDPPPR